MIKRLINSYKTIKHKQLRFIACMLLAAWVSMEYVSCIPMEQYSSLIELSEIEKEEKQEKEKDIICLDFNPYLSEITSYTLHKIDFAKKWESPYMKQLTPPPNVA